MGITDAVVEINCGKLKGISREGILAFKGIPYAAPPVDELRWLPPVDPKPWSGIRDASEYGRWACKTDLRWIPSWAARKENNPKTA